MATYKLTDNDITLMIKLRATNDAIFTGRRNSALRAWRAIGKEMGLQGKVTTIRLKKKWENFKDKYKELKNCSIVEENKGRPVSWRWYHLMDQAMTGCLAGSAHILNPSLFDMEDEEELAMPDKKLCMRPEALQGHMQGLVQGHVQGHVFGMNMFEAEDGGHDNMAAVDHAADDIRQTTVVECERALKEEARTMGEDDGDAPGDAALLYATIVSNGDGAVAGNNPYLVVNNDPPVLGGGGRNVAGETAELDHQIVELEKERLTLEREQAEFDRERLLLERERELLSREMANVERNRAALDGERVAMDRERAALDRDRAVLDRDRALIEKDRAELQREKEAVRHCRLYQSNGCPAAELDPERLERRERLISLFERFIEKL